MAFYTHMREAIWCMAGRKKYTIRSESLLLSTRNFGTIWLVYDMKTMGDNNNRSLAIGFLPFGVAQKLFFIV